MKKLKTTLSLLLLFVTTSVWAQDNCSAIPELLDRIQTEYINKKQYNDALIRLKRLRNHKDLKGCYNLTLVDERIKEVEALSNSSKMVRDFVVTVNNVSFKMIYVDDGSFVMGASKEQDMDAEPCEGPIHEVELSSYWIGETEVTQELWKAVMGENPSYFDGNSMNPVDNVSWYDCRRFIEKLNDLTASQRPYQLEFRLPSEEEWEFAARGGKKNMSNQRYAGATTLDGEGWYEGNSSSKTHPVRSKKPNALGIYDMSGNVSEWCYDAYRTSYQVKANDKDATRVLRGGCCVDEAVNCRVTSRSCGQKGDKNLKNYYYLGLRLSL